MAWIADPKALRTYDPERGLELKRGAGGSGGKYGFSIHKICDLDGKPLSVFYAHEKHRYPTDNEKQNNPGIRGFTTWTIDSHALVFKPDGGRYTLEESEAIIREAMLVHRDLHGKPLGGEWVFDVRVDSGTTGN